MKPLLSERSRLQSRLALLALILMGCESPSESPIVGSAPVPSHVLWARDLVDNIEPERNEYGSNPTRVQWAGVDGADEYENRSVCGTFVTHTLRRAHGLSDSDIDT
ncbi:MULTISPECIES: hypothetical protein [Sorangium]|uniref:hypothetical protein n=1 Tax=Sorangium TaxID=39643 RepID=UPI00101A0FDE|nr:MULTISPECIES: hypothetical protein [Sorangium]WCQ90558.1 hypothetical protein NQZ70_03269 [Sorangium sp. Soce836]